MDLATGHGDTPDAYLCDRRVGGGGGGGAFLSHPSYATAILLQHPNSHCSSYQLLLIYHSPELYCI